MNSTIVTQPGRFTAARGKRLEARHHSTMRAALLVSPIGFDVSEETARDNRYMKLDSKVDPERAQAQHAAVVRRLTELGVPTLLFPGQIGLRDAVYPNNVYATVPGRFIVGSMKHPERRQEAAREDVRRLFTESFRYELHDLSGRDCTAELTGPMVVDRGRAIGYCGLSGRADEVGCEAMHEAFGFELTFRFALAPAEYHTNLVLAILASRACVLHAPSFADPDVPKAIAAGFEDCTLFLSDEEKATFAGNCIAVTERDILMSRTATQALRQESRGTLERCGFRLHDAEIDELEKGGGSLRCLIAEVF